MANFKRKKSKRQVRCTLCTSYSWLGNHKERHRRAIRRQNEADRVDGNE